MNMHKLQQILMQMHGAESDTSISFASTNEHWVMEISYLEQQIVFLEMLYAAGVQRIETLVQLVCQDWLLKCVLPRIIMLNSYEELPSSQ